MHDSYAPGIGYGDAPDGACFVCHFEFSLLETLHYWFKITPLLYQQNHCIFNGFQRFCIKVGVRLPKAPLNANFDIKLAFSIFA